MQLGLIEAAASGEIEQMWRAFEAGARMDAVGPDGKYVPIATKPGAKRACMDLQNRTPYIVIMDNNRIGYSPKINDPAFAKYIKDTNKWSGYFSLGLAFVAVLGFFINGEVSDDIQNPESLYIGFVIGGIFLIIAFYQITSRNRSKTWDGTVIDKKVEKKHRHDKYQDCWREYLEYKVTIEAGNGRKHDLIAEDDDTKYNYYQIGDRVRHHNGLKEL